MGSTGRLARQLPSDLVWEVAGSGPVRLGTEQQPRRSSTPEALHLQVPDTRHHRTRNSVAHVLTEAR